MLLSFRTQYCGDITIEVAMISIEGYFIFCVLSVTHTLYFHTFCTYNLPIAFAGFIRHVNLTLIKSMNCNGPHSLIEWSS